MAISLYSTPSCPYCVQAKRYLQQQGIPFTEYNVASDVRRADEILVFDQGSLAESRSWM